ncbi:MAG TPA: hypothetical protein VGH33_03250 [Isosphaeraceae bacterium]|jgi:hypothetical protein
MQTLALLLVAAATTGDGYSKPYAGGLKLFRHQAVMEGAPPPGGPIGPAGAGAPGAAGMGGGMAGQPGRRFPNVRSQVIFLDPKDMKIAWQTSAGPGGERIYTPGLVVPDQFNFLQGYIYRLKISDIQGRPGVSLYPTIEVAPSTPATDAYLTHNAIPVQFTAEDFDQVVDGGNFVTKVIYLPDPKYQELAVPGGPETLISTRLEPGVDPILEADKRGTILLIVRLGGINLELPQTGTVMVPSTINSVPVDGAPTVVPGPATLVPPVEPAPAPAPVVPPAGVVPVAPAPVVPPAPAPATTPGPGAASASLSPPSPEPPAAIPPIEPPPPVPVPAGGN